MVKIGKPSSSVDWLLPGCIAYERRYRLYHRRCFALLMRLGFSEKRLCPRKPRAGQQNENAPYLLGLAAISLLVWCLLFPARAALLSRSHYGKVGALGLWRGVHDYWPHSARCCRAVSLGNHKGVPRRDRHGTGYSRTDRDHATFLGYKVAGSWAARWLQSPFHSDFFILSLLIPYYDR